MADDSGVPDDEGNRSLAATKAFSKTIPGFALSAYDSATLMDLLLAYGPYSNGETALFWHIVGLIGRCRKVDEPEEPEGGWKTPAGKLLGVEIPIPTESKDPAS